MSAFDGITYTNGTRRTGVPILPIGPTTGVQAVQSHQVADSYAVVVHTDYPRYANLTEVITALNNLGVYHARNKLQDNAAGLTQLGNMQTIYNATGVKFSGPCGDAHGNGLNAPGDPGTPEGIVDNVASFSGASAFIEGFEGSNEENLQETPTWYPNHTAAHQQRLYNYVKGHGTPWVAASTVIGPSLGKKTGYTELSVATPAIQGYMDVGNIHLYDAGYTTGDYYLPNIIILAHKVSGSTKALWATEGGTHNAMNSTAAGDYPISETADGKAEPKRLLEYFLQGVNNGHSHGLVRCTKYELMDQGTSLTDKQKRFGLIRYDGSYKPAFTSMRNLLALLDDPGATFTPGLLPYLIDGAPADLRQLLLQKRDGRFFLVLWRNLSLYDRDTRIDYTDAQIGVVSMTLQLQILQKITTWSPTAGVVLDPANPTATAGGALSITTGLSSAFTMAGGIRVIEIGAP